MTLVTVPITDDLVRGALELERTDRGLLPHRLPAWARRQIADGQLAMVESQPSGVRLAMRTEATTLELDAIPTKRGYVGAPTPPDGVYDLVVDGTLAAQASIAGGDRLEIDMRTGSFDLHPGEPGTVRFADLPAGSKDVELWLPYDETTVLVALRADAPVVGRPTGRRTWVHHGSSISHGSVSASPTATWPAVAAAAGRVDLVNLGLGGSALLDPAVARVIRDQPADLISLKIGINLVNLDLMRRRALGPAIHGFLDLIRDGHPDTPLLVVTPLFCGIHEDTPGPAAPDRDAFAEGRVAFVATGDPAEVALGRLTLRVIRDELTRVVAERATADPALHLLDGLALYGADDTAAHPLPDALHPDAETQRLIGSRFADRAFGDGGAFATTPTGS